MLEKRGGRVGHGGRSMEDRMGTIHQLNPRSRTSLTGETASPSAPCEIVIFPGVRIERHEDVVFVDNDAPGRDDRPRKSS